MGCGRLFSRIGVKDGLAPATANKLEITSTPEEFIWVEPDPMVVRILQTVTRERRGREAARELQKTEYDNPIELWERIRGTNPLERSDAEVLILLAWSWKGEGRHFAEQRTSGSARGVATRHGVVQNERVRLSTLATRVLTHATAPWPKVTIVQATAGQALQVLPTPNTGDHVNVDRPYKATTKYSNAHSMPDAELLDVCRWGMAADATVSVHEARPLVSWLQTELGEGWEEFDLKGTRAGANPRFSRSGEWLMVRAL